MTSLTTRDILSPAWFDNNKESSYENFYYQFNYEDNTFNKDFTYYINDTYQTIEVKGTDGIIVNTESISSDVERFINNIFKELDPKLDIDFKRVYSSNDAFVSIYKGLPSDADTETFRGVNYTTIDEEINDTIFTTKNEVFWIDTPGESQFLDGYGNLAIDTAHTIQHEISHALHLRHQEYGYPYLESLFDPNDYRYDWQDTIMSYDTESLVANDLAPLFTDLDIEALKFIWGTEKATTSTSTSTSTSNSTDGMATSTELQQLYIAYFGRPCDPLGLDYWTQEGISRSAFATNMHLQPEFQNVNGNLSVESQINQIYMNLFSRPADVTGLTYWSTQIKNGSLLLASIANDLIWAAENNSGSSDDATALANKTNAAIAYTSKISEKTSLILDYQPQSTSPWITGNNLTEAINYISGINKYTSYTLSGIENSIEKFNTIFASNNSTLSIDSEQSKIDYITGLEIHTAETNNFTDTTNKLNSSSSDIFDYHSLKDINHQEFVSHLYEELPDREADSIGMNYWPGQLNSGSERRYEVLPIFPQSADNTALFKEITEWE